MCHLVAMVYFNRKILSTFVNLCQPLSTHYILQIWLISNQLSVVTVVIAEMRALHFR